MIYDAQDPSTESLPTYDLAIVGTGVVGQTLLARLMDTGLRIAVIESGSRVPTPGTDRLKAVRTPRFSIADDSRERFLGGSANTWGRGCVKLDAIDMEKRSWVANSGWPFTRDDLEVHYQAAIEDLEIIDTDAIVDDRSGSALCGDELTSHFLVYTDHLRGFDEATLETIRTSADIDLFLNSNVVSIELDDLERHATGLRIRSLGGSAFVVRAEEHVIACGGIENSRLLLMSPTKDGRGVGNANDVVGRYFMEHPKGLVGFIVPESEEPELATLVDHAEGLALRGGVSLTEAVQRERRLLNSHVRFVVERRLPLHDNEGVRLAIAILTRKRAGIDDVGVAAMATTLVRNLPQISSFLLHRLLRRGRQIERIWLKNLTEMEPVASNRVRLDDLDVDELGCPLAVVDYEPTELDKASMAELHRAIGERVAALGFGRLESPLLDSIDDWEITTDASHHLGGTRMGDDPTTSVVDGDGRVHGIDNLYIAGSSVFPSGGYANPTLTIIALGIRLAEHLITKRSLPTPPTPLAPGRLG